MSEERLIRRDRMRFTKNTASSRLALLAILLNVLFFVSIYKVNREEYYVWLMGVSILYNLVFMLAAFLASEGVKKYNVRYSVLMAVLGAGQMIRIFILPAIMHATVYEEKIPIYKVSKRMGQQIVGYDKIERLVMPDDQYTRLIVYLGISALCLLAGALINWHKSRELKAQIAASGSQQA